ncbi:MAG: hypothetical protein KAQ83_03475, partial [Nanoarchaeota archaeon]|nr:hypothetical protein [Nanoarchaeota archaeon]
LIKGVETKPRMDLHPHQILEAVESSAPSIYNVIRMPWLGKTLCKLANFWGDVQFRDYFVVSLNVEQDDSGEVLENFYEKDLKKLVVGSRGSLNYRETLPVGFVTRYSHPERGSKHIHSLYLNLGLGENVSAPDQYNSFIEALSKTTSFIKENKGCVESICLTTSSPGSCDLTPIIQRPFHFQRSANLFIKFNMQDSLKPYTILSDSMPESKGGGKRYKGIILP